MAASENLAFIKEERMHYIIIMSITLTLSTGEHLNKVYTVPTDASSVAECIEQKTVLKQQVELIKGTKVDSVGCVQAY